MKEIRRAPVELGSLSHYLQGFIHAKWCRISSINSSSLLFPREKEMYWGMRVQRNTQKPWKVWASQSFKSLNKFNWNPFPELKTIYFLKQHHMFHTIISSPDVSNLPCTSPNDFNSCTSNGFPKRFLPPKRFNKNAPWHVAFALVPRIGSLGRLIRWRYCNGKTHG